MNIYWPIYKNLEAGVIKLTYAIYIDDSQLNVYSSDISDLILRASAEIESISKELYKANGGAKTDKIKYDSDALEHLNKIWLLEEKVILISSINCYQSMKELRPFAKNEASTFHGKSTFSWNNSYQNLKHDRAKSLKFGSVKYLFDIMSALFLLNLYFKNESYPLEKDGNAVNFPINMGSELFSIKIQKDIGFDSEVNPLINADTSKCVYVVKHTEVHREKVKQAYQQQNIRLVDFLNQSHSFKKYISEGGKLDDNDNNIHALMYKIFDSHEHSQMMHHVQNPYIEVIARGQYEAVLNKNNVTQINYMV